MAFGMDVMSSSMGKILPIACIDDDFTTSIIDFGASDFFFLCDSFFDEISANFLGFSNDLKNLFMPRRRFSCYCDSGDIRINRLGRSRLHQRSIKIKSPFFTERDPFSSGQ